MKKKKNRERERERDSLLLYILKKKKGSIEETLVLRLVSLGIEFNENDPRKAFVNECLSVLVNIQDALLQVCASGGKLFDTSFCIIF